MHYLININFYGFYTCGETEVQFSTNRMLTNGEIMNIVFNACKNMENIHGAVKRIVAHGYYNPNQHPIGNDDGLKHLTPDSKTFSFIF